MSVQSYSRPATYLIWSAVATDGAAHAVKVYFDASSELTVNTPDQRVLLSRVRLGDLDVLRAGSQQQPLLEKYGDNLRINPFEVGLEHTVDLDKRARFIGQDALRRIADGTTPRRQVVAFTIDGEDMPDLETFWPVMTPGDGERIGVVWQAGYSYALERHAGDALLDQPTEIGTRLELLTPSGPISSTVVSRPLVPEGATEPGRS